MKTVLMLKGLPASGKGTFCDEFMKSHKGWKRINKDDLRAMVDSGVYSGKNEKVIVSLRDFLLRYFMNMGYNVIIDDTNLNPVHESNIQRIVDEYNKEYELEVKFFDVPVEECIFRDRNRANSVGSDVIYGMYNKYLDTHTHDMVDNTKREAYIVDLDGTLAHANGRSMYTIGKELLTDKPNRYLINLVNALSISASIIVVSGRDSRGRGHTEEWLYNNNVEYHRLFMRKATDNRADTIIKQEIYDTQIKPYYEVYGVFDDRPSVIRMWKRNNLLVLNCDQRMYHSEF